MEIETYVERLAKESSPRGSELSFEWLAAMIGFESEEQGEKITRELKAEAVARGWVKRHGRATALSREQGIALARWYVRQNFEGAA